MSATAVDAGEDAEVDAQPLRLRAATVRTLVVARETADLGNDPLQERERGREGGYLVYTHSNTTCL